MSTNEHDSATALLREVNDRIRAQAAGPHVTSRYLCECGDDGCRLTVMLTATAFDAHRRARRAAGILAHRRA